MIKGKNFVFTGLQPWDLTFGSNAKDIALEISKHNQVLYINTPLDKKTFNSKENTPQTIHRKKVISGKNSPLRQINPNLWVLDYPFAIWPISFLPDGKVFDLVNQINNRKMYKYVKQILNELHFSDYYLFTDNDIYRSFYAKEYLKPALAIYYRRDNLLPMPFWKKHAPRLEPLLIEKYDLVVCNSIQLCEYALQFNKQSFDVGQGVDLSEYNIDNTFNQPADIQSIKRPIVGYIGDITSLRLDANIIYQLALKNPGLSFVLVGRADSVFQNHKLNQLSNVYFLGLKPRELVPAYIHSFDICINPQIVNEVTIGNYPRKIDEFLAFGKPTIATDTLAMQMFKEHVYLCESVEDYQQALEAILKDNNQQKIQERICFSHSHSWENSVIKIFNAIISTQK